MAAVVNKRQQARNERTLQELIRSVPGNDRCADCFTRNPGWASWNLGIFLCMRCAGLHRKLGTHISKVKSLSMDTWTVDQVENMKQTGNLVSNKRYNPRAQKPNIPVDADEVDSAMERFIREKYQHKTLSGESRPLPSVQHLTGSSSSTEDVPPPPPPKSVPRFSSGLRSSSSNYPQSSQAPLPSPPVSESTVGSRSGSSRMARIPESEPLGRRRSFDTKLDSLRDMGFANESRNSTVLKGVGGDVDKAIDTLVRLGEGSGPVSRARTPAHVNGLSFDNSTSDKPAQPSPQRQAFHTQTQSTQSTQSAPATSPNNPFFQAPVAQTQPFPLEQQMQNMQISNQAQQAPLQQQQQQQQQPLFPNNTGSWPVNQHNMANLQSNPFLKTFTPPISPSPNQYSSTQQGANPFLRSTQSQTFAPTNPYGSSVLQQQQQSFSQATSPYEQTQPPPMPNMTGWAQRSVSQPQPSPFQTQPQQNVAQDFFSIQPHPQQQPQQQAQYLYQSPTVQSPAATGQSYPGSFVPQQPQQQQPQQQHYPTYPPPQQPQQQQQQFYQGQMQRQQTGYSMQPQRHDKNSILALYNQTNPYAAQQNGQLQYQQQQQQQPQPEQQQQPQYQQYQQYQQQDPQQPQRSATMPLPSSSNNNNTGNPFAALAPAMTQGRGHVSQESMAFTGAPPARTASPDAFSGLSARWR